MTDFHSDAPTESEAEKMQRSLSNSETADQETSHSHSLS
jgi:hypothetical protein